MAETANCVATKNMRNAPPFKPLERPERTPEELREWHRIREAWLAGLGPEAHFHKMFDHIPGLHFFAKNREGRLMFASEALRDRYSMRDEDEILGRTDFDLNPDLMARAYVDDDLRLLNGEAVVERLELWWDAQGMPDWFVVTKLPLRDREGFFQGVMGVLRRPSETDRELPVFQTVAKAVEMIRRDYSRPVTITEIARTCGQSVRQLQRKFMNAFGVTPQEFLIKTRLLASQHLLEESGLTIGEIAEKCGFVDSSSFIQHFRKRTGSTPSVYRRKSRGEE